MRQLLLTLFLAAVCVPYAAAAGPAEGSWLSVRDLQAGRKVRVVAQDLRSFRGDFIRASEQSIEIETREGPVSVERDEVLRVTLQDKTRRGRNALLGLAIGAGAGLAVGAVADRGPNEGGEGALFKKAFTTFGLGMGAGIGALIPSHPTIYRAVRTR